MKRILCAAALAAATSVAATSPGHAFSAGGTYLLNNKADGGPHFSYCVVLQSIGASAPYRDVGYVTFPSIGYTGTYVVFKHQLYAAISSTQNGDSVAFTATIKGVSPVDTTYDDFFPGQPALIAGTGSFTSVRDHGCTNTQVPSHTLIGN